LYDTIYLNLAIKSIERLLYSFVFIPASRFFAFFRSD